MKIQAVAFAPPGRVLSNDDVLSLVIDNSRAYSSDTDIARLQMLLLALLQRAGARERRWLGPGETPLDLTRHAVNTALERAECFPDDVDLVISTGIDRGFIEPSNASMICQALGLPRAQCFDIVDACHSWVRALEISEGFILRDPRSRILVISAEFGLFEHGPVYPDLFRYQSEHDIASKFAALTLGEGAAATLVGAGSTPWVFHHRARNDLAHLSSITLPGYTRYCIPSPEIGHSGLGRFTGFGSALFAAAKEEIPELLAEAKLPLDSLQIVFTHGATRREWLEEASAYGIADRMFFSFSEYGNIGSASIPASMALAQSQGRLKRGDRFAICVASSGMVFTVAMGDY